MRAMPCVDQGALLHHAQGAPGVVFGLRWGLDGAS